MALSDLPIVCGYCRMPLRYVRGHLVMKNGRPHFYMGKTCLFVTTELAQRIDTLRGKEVNQ